MFVGVAGLSGSIYVPRNYVSGRPLVSTLTWDKATFASLGVTPGTYVWKWGSGANAGSFTLRAAVPEPTTLGLMMLGLLGAGFAGRKRRNRPTLLADVKTPQRSTYKNAHVAAGVFVLLAGAVVAVGALYVLIWLVHTFL